MTGSALADLADYTEQAEVTNWPARLVLVVAFVGLVLLALWGMRRGWRNRAARQADLPPPAAPPTGGLGAGWLVQLPGRYLATTRAGDWLDRVVVHGLGVPARGDVSVGTAGVLIRRDAAADLFVPAADLRDVRVDRGIAGSVFEAGGVVVVTWDLGGTALDTGFRAARTGDHVELVRAVARLCPVPDGGTR